jgi:hypothetical protein
MTAQGFFIGALGVAVFKTATITSTSSVFINVEAHSIAFSALYFWIVPAVFLSSVIGVSQTKSSIPRILNNFARDPFIADINLPELDDIGKVRIVSGGIYSWNPRSEAIGWTRNLLPIFTVFSGTVTAMLISGNVPAYGWQPRHCAYATFLSIWILSFLATNWLKQLRNAPAFHRFLPTTWRASDGDLGSRKGPLGLPVNGPPRLELRYFGEPELQDVEQPLLAPPDGQSLDDKYVTFWITFLKDTIVALGTLGALMYIQTGPFNDCASYTDFGHKRLALPGMPEVAAILNSRIQNVYPAIAFTSIGVHALLVPIIVVVLYPLALSVLWQTDSTGPSWLSRWFGKIWFGKGGNATYSQGPNVSANESDGWKQ